jgi:hypothetical protein
MDWPTFIIDATRAVAFVIAINVPIAVFMLFLGGPKKAVQP